MDAVQATAKIESERVRAVVHTLAEICADERVRLFVAIAESVDDGLGINCVGCGIPHESFELLTAEFLEQ